MIVNEPLVLEPYKNFEQVGKQVRSVSVLFLFFAALYTALSLTEKKPHLDELLLIDAGLLLAWCIFIVISARLRLAPAVHIYRNLLVVSDDGEQSTEIHFDEIEAVTKYSLWPLANSLFTLNMKEGRKWHSKVGCQRKYEILRAIQEYKPSLISKKEFEYLYQRIICEDYNMIRREKFFAKFSFVKFFTLISGGVLAPTLASAFYYKKNVSHLNTFFRAYILNLIWGCLVFLVVDFFIRKRALSRAQQNMNPTESIQYKTEKKIYLLGYVIFVLLIFFELLNNLIKLR